MIVNWILRVTLFTNYLQHHPSAELPKDSRCSLFVSNYKQVPRDSSNVVELDSTKNDFASNYFCSYSTAQTAKSLVMSGRV